VGNSTVQDFVEGRLLVTKDVLGKSDNKLVENTIEEVKAIYGYEDKADNDLSVLEKSYLADRIAATVLRYSLDRYKEDAKVKVGSDSVEHEYQDKLKYLKEQISQLDQQAEMKEGRLGLNSGSIPPLVLKIPAGSEEEE